MLNVRVHAMLYLLQQTLIFIFMLVKKHIDLHSLKASWRSNFLWMLTT